MGWSKRVNHIMILKRLLLLFWAIWLTVVLLSNLADAGQALGVVGPSWMFASGNFKAIKVTTVRYGIADLWNTFLFAGVIFWEAIAVVLFWRALFSYQGKKSGRSALYLAFTTTLSLWAAFLIVDEIFIAYPMEAAHFRLFCSQLLTLLAIELLPDD